MSKKQFDLLVIGEINPDLILSGENVTPAFGQAEKLVQAATLTIGSSSAIMSCGAARLALAARQRERLQHLARAPALHERGDAAVRGHLGLARERDHARGVERDRPPPLAHDEIVLERRAAVLAPRYSGEPSFSKAPKSLPHFSGPSSYATQRRPAPS